jgi:hypothetical protein
MNNILYYIAVLLILFWLIGFVGLGLGGMIHLLLFFAIISVVFRVIAGRRPV